MIGDNIKRLRKSSGMSQEELAAELAVVRQTVSKWERGTSVPDAETAARMARLFHVSVNELLDAEPGSSVEELTEELARVKEQLTEKSRKERSAELAGEKRGIILALCSVAMISALVVKNQIFSLCLIGLCFMIALFVLYRNMALLTAAQETGIRALKIASVFDAVVLAGSVAAAVLSGFDLLPWTGDKEKIFAAAVLSGVMIFSGMISPQLPFNRHTGLRLPWTVRDEDTWNVAHRTIGFTALPIALLYLAGTVSIDNFEAVSVFAMIAWLGIPALLSFVFWRQKVHNRL